MRKLMHLEIDEERKKEDSVFVDMGKVPYLFDEKVPELC